MSWDLYGDVILTADIAALSARQKFKLTNNTLLLGLRAWLVFFNDPALTSLSMSIYSDSAGSPGTLLATSATITKASIITDLNGVKDVPFSFNSPKGVPLKSGTFYHAVLNANGYTGTSSSHIAWKKAWPDPAYTTGLGTIEVKGLGLSPRSLSFVGAKL